MGNIPFTKQCHPAHLLTKIIPFLSSYAILNIFSQPVYPLLLLLQLICAELSENEVFCDTQVAGLDHFF